MAMLRRQKDTDAARRKKTGRPIFRTIFNAMMLVTLVEVVLLAVSIAITNVDGRLNQNAKDCLLYTSPSPRDVEESRMPSSA